MDKMRYAHCVNLLNMVCGTMTASTMFSTTDTKKMVDLLLAVDPDAHFPTVAYSMALSSRGEASSAKSWLLGQMDKLREREIKPSAFLEMEMARVFRENGDYNDSKNICDALVERFQTDETLNEHHAIVEMMALAYLDDFSKGKMDGGYISSGVI